MNLQPSVESNLKRLQICNIQIMCRYKYHFFHENQQCGRSKAATMLRAVTIPFIYILTHKSVSVENRCVSVPTQTCRNVLITFLELLLTDTLLLFLFLAVVSVASLLFALFPPFFQALLPLLHQALLKSFQFFL